MKWEMSMVLINKERRFLTMRAMASERRGCSELTVIGRRAPLLRGRYEVFVETDGRRIFSARGDFNSVYDALEDDRKAEGLELLRSVAKELRDPKGYLTAFFSRRELLAIDSAAGDGKTPYRGVELTHDMIGSPLSRVLRSLAAHGVLRPDKVICGKSGIFMGFKLTDKGRAIACMLKDDSSFQEYKRRMGLVSACSGARQACRP